MGEKYGLEECRQERDALRDALKRQEEASEPNATALPQPDARAKLDWEAALRSVYSHYYGGEAEWQRMLDAVEAIAWEFGNWCAAQKRGYTLEDAEAEIRRLVRGKEQS
jgi:hypothetical protein